MHFMFLFTISFLLIVNHRGQGLGKNEDGIVKHIKAVKKEENTGV